MEQNNSSTTDQPSQLEASMSEYHKNGYLIVENALTPEDIQAAKEALAAISHKYAFNDSLCEYKPAKDNGHNQSGALFQAKNARTFFQSEPGFEPSADDMNALELSVRKYMWFEDEAPVFQFLSKDHPVLGPYLRSALQDTPTLYQSMALVKPPFGGVEKPWHQDNAYFSVEDMQKVIGVWIPLDDADASNGCIHVLEGGHKIGPLRHHHTSDCEIVPGKLDPTQAKPLEMKAGSALLFHGNLPHQTPINNTDRRRRALQFHYRAQSNAIIPKKDYYKIFKEADGTPASCAAALPKNF